jgi:hypothetical protein
LSGSRITIDLQGPQIAAVRGEQTGAEPHQGGLAGAVRPDQAGDHVRPDGAAHPGKGGDSLFAHGEGFADSLQGQGGLFGKQSGIVALFRHCRRHCFFRTNNGCSSSSTMLSTNEPVVRSIMFHFLNNTGTPLTKT